MPKVLNEKQVYPDPSEESPRGVIRVTLRSIEEDDGKRREQYVWERPEFVVVIPETPSGKIFAKCEFKYAVMEELLTFAAGAVKKGELPITAAIRELRQEFALSAEGLIPIGEYRVSPDKSTETQHVFVAKNCSPIIGATPEPGTIVIGTPEEILRKPNMTIALFRAALYDAVAQEALLI